MPLLLLAALTITQAGLALGQISFGATLTVLRGTTSVVRGDGSAVHRAGSGLTLNAGDRIATVGKSSALVTFFDGSEIELGENTTIALQDASGEVGGVVTFLIEVVLGNTLHKVETLKNPGSSYKIVAGEGLVEVRGTTVGVGVDWQKNATAFLQQGQATFNGHNLSNGEACTLGSSGAFECENRKGSNPLSTVADPVVDGAPPKEGGLSNTTKTDDEKDKKPDPTSTPGPRTPPGSVRRLSTSGPYVLQVAARYRRRSPSVKIASSVLASHH